MHVTHVSIDNETGEFTVRGPLAGTSAALFARVLLAVSISISILPLPLHCALDSCSRANSTRVCPRNGSAC
jgi:hypothetical protein